jgi:aminomethyltransferase
VSPLFKYDVSGPGAEALVNRVITRDATRIAPGRIVYTPWCDEHGHVLDDGLVMRAGEQHFHWTAADPNLSWLRRNAAGLDVTIEDVSEKSRRCRCRDQRRGTCSGRSPRPTWMACATFT